MSNNVLVTGGAGYIGSHTCKALAQAGFTPITVDNLCNGNRWAIQWGPWEKADIDDQLKVASLIERYDIKSVIHFAAFAYVGESIQYPGMYFDNNVSKSLKLLDTLTHAGVENLVFSSSCAVYGLPEKLPISEDAPKNPINPYGETKLAIERALKWYAQAHGFRAIALRYFNAAGADPDGEIGEHHVPETHLIPLVIEAARKQADPICVFGTDYPTRDGTAVRDYIHVTDLAQAHVLALTRLLEGADNASINIGTGTGYSVREIIAAVEQLAPAGIPVADHPRRPGDPAELVASPRLAAELLQWSPRYSDLETIIQSAWDWHSQSSQINRFGRPTDFPHAEKSPLTATGQPARG